MTRNWKNRIVHTMFFLFLLLTACNNREDHAGHDTYTCPMHPTVISDKPGTCPVCGMDLVRKARPGEEVEITKALRDAIKSPDQSVLSAVKTITPEYKSLSVSVKGVGIVTYDTRRLYTVPARVGGRIEKGAGRLPRRRMEVAFRVESLRWPTLPLGTPGAEMGRHRLGTQQDDRSKP